MQCCTQARILIYEHPALWLLHTPHALFWMLLGKYGFGAFFSSPCVLLGGHPWQAELSSYIADHQGLDDVGGILLYSLLSGENIA